MTNISDTQSLFLDERDLPPEYLHREPEVLSYEEIQDSPEFDRLRKRLLRFIFPVTGLFLAWFMVFVLLSDYAPAFMGHVLFAKITVGLVIGMAQFITTIAVVIWYVRFAEQNIDPDVETFRSQLRNLDD